MHYVPSEKPGLESCHCLILLSHPCPQDDLSQCLCVCPKSLPSSKCFLLHPDFDTGLLISEANHLLVPAKQSFPMGASTPAYLQHCPPHLRIYLRRSLLPVFHTVDQGHTVFIFCRPLRSKSDFFMHPMNLNYACPQQVGVCSRTPVYGCETCIDCPYESQNRHMTKA